MKTMLQLCLLSLTACVLPAVSLYAQTVAPELNLTLGERRVRSAPTRSFQEMRLEVVNSLGESVFTHTTTEAAFDWNLRAGNGEALAPAQSRLQDRLQAVPYSGLRRRQVAIRNGRN